MHTKFHSFLIAVLVAGLPFGGLRAAEPANSPEVKLREALKNSMLQLRDAQNQVVTLQTAQAASDQEKADLKTQLEALTKRIDELTRQSIADKTAADKAVAALTAQVAQKDGELGQFKEALGKWKAGYGQVLDIAKTKEVERAKLAGDNIVLQRTVEDRENRNRELFQLGNEILTRYEKFGLGDALAAKEPFVGTARVKMENMVQDYQDKLTAKRISPEDKISVAETAATPDQPAAQRDTTTASVSP